MSVYYDLYQLYQTPNPSPEEGEKKTLHTHTDYEQLTGRARHQAVADLNGFLEEGIIRKYGSGKTVVYLKAAR